MLSGFNILKISKSSDESSEDILIIKLPRHRNSVRISTSEVYYNIEARLESYKRVNELVNERLINYYSDKRLQNCLIEDSTVSHDHRSKENNHQQIFFAKLSQIKSLKSTRNELRNIFQLILSLSGTIF
jgi:hypothetical protein